MRLTVPRMGSADGARFAEEVIDLLGGEDLNVVVHDSLASTNALGVRFAKDVLREAGTVRRTLFVAREQTAGRGRRGNAWLSPAGLGVYASLVEPLASGARAEGLPLAVGAGLARASNELLGQPACRLKWPNDLLVGEAKLGGLLIELVEHDGDAAAVIGFGINTHRAPGGPLATRATSLAALGREVPSLAACVANLTLGATAALAWTSDEAIAHYRGLLMHRAGDALTFQLAGERISGTFLAVDERGHLHLRTAEGERTFSSGEVLHE